MSKHFVRITNGTLDLITTEYSTTVIRHIPTDFDVNLIEMEISEAVARSIMDDNYTIDHSPQMEWVEINGETAFPTSKSFRFIPRFVLSLPTEALRMLKDAGVEESWVRLYAYKEFLWAEPGPWGTRSEMTISRPIGNFGFVIPPFKVPGDVMAIEIHVCNDGCYYLYLQFADTDVYIQIAEIAEIV